MVCDCKTVYCFSLEHQCICYCCTYGSLLSETQLYAETMESEIYGFTAEYNVYDWEVEEFYYEDAEGEEISELAEYEEQENDALPVPCMLIKLSAENNTCETLYFFTGMPQTMPTVKYIPASKSFLLFNYKSMQIEQFFCENGNIRFLFEALTRENDMPPNAIHIHPNHPEEFYFMYPENCYLTSITASRFSVLMKYPIRGINKLLSDSAQERDLTFKTFVVPANNRFIVGTDTNVYEWNSEEDTLILKYNLAYYNCTDLIYDSEQERIFDTYV